CDSPDLDDHQITLNKIDEKVAKSVIEFLKLQEYESPFHWYTDSCEGDFSKFEETCKKHAIDHKVFTRQPKVFLEILKCSKKGESFKIEVRHCWEEDNSVWIHNGNVVDKVCVCPKCHVEFAWHPAGVETTVCPECFGETRVRELSQHGRRHPAWDIPINTPLLGFTIQTIVEGSDVYVNGDFMEVPIATEKIQEWLDEMEKESDFYWKRDNWRWFTVIDPNNNGYSVEMTWEGWNWDDESHPSNKNIPVEVRQAIEKLFEDDTNRGSLNSFILENYGYGDEKAQYVPEHEGWKAYEWLNDSPY
ncbi:MAG TPA: hypothetical protein VMW36_08760, partial [Patescibacteria group bacterium]|nr:hypothetical protein [Patescibacteria group bacterium]